MLSHITLSTTCRASFLPSEAGCRNAVDPLAVQLLLFPFLPAPLLELEQLDAQLAGKLALHLVRTVGCVASCTAAFKAASTGTPAYKASSAQGCRTDSQSSGLVSIQRTLVYTAVRFLYAALRVWLLHVVAQLCLLIF